MKNWLKIILVSFMFVSACYSTSLAVGDFSYSDTPNAPILYNGMTPIKWDNSYEIETKSDDLSWYNYENKKWANAKDDAGNYWVWIPRYTYKILNDGTVCIAWSSGTEDFIGNGYMVHPAFIADAYTGGDPNEAGNYKNGNGSEELTGFWIAKYMVSDNDGNVSIEPNRYPDVNKNIGEAFNYCLNMENSLGVSTHLIKASEWGAVSYLTEAFGVVPTENSTKFTGGNNSNSTTNNIYGVFDMNGPVGEYLASFVMKDTLNSGVIEYAGNMIYEEYENLVDIVNLTENDNADNNDKRLEEFFGFAMSETKNFVGTDYENVPTGSEPFFTKGGSGVGMFGYGRTNGIGLGYRPTLSVYSSYLSEDVAFFDTEASVVAGDYLVVSVNFSVDKDWKFELDEDEVIIENGKVIQGKETRIFDFIDLRYAQNNKSMTLTNANLNEHLISIIEGDNTLTSLSDETIFKANVQYTVRVRIGGYNDKGVPVFLAIPGMTSKIVVNSIDVVSTSGIPLKVSSILNNKVRLSIYDSQGRIPVLDSVRLISAPDKKDYYKGEKLSLIGGTLEVSYGDNKAVIELTKDNVVNYENVTAVEGEDQLVNLIYSGVSVTQDDVEFKINVKGNQKFYVKGNVNPLNTAVIVSGLGQYSEGEQVHLKANVYPGYKFSSWVSKNVSIQNSNSIDEAYFSMPNSNVTVTVNTIGAYRLEIKDPKTEFERGDSFELGDGKIIAYYPDGSSEELTLNSPGVTSNPSKNEILDELGEKEVTIKYGGIETTYDINIVKEKYNLTFYIDSLNAGSIKIGEKVILPIENEDTLTTTVRISYDDTVKVKAEPADGYAFYGWYISDKEFILNEDLTSSEISFIMPQKSLILKATFVEAHTVKYMVNDNSYGEILGEKEQFIKHGENGEKVTAVAKNGYKFKEWVQDGRTEPDRLDQYVVADATYTARFVKTYTVQYLIDGVTFAERVVEYGSSGYISEVPEKVGSVFDKWVDINGDDAKLDHVVSDMVVYAKVIPWIEFNPNGSIEAKDVVETQIIGRTVKEGTFEYIVSESEIETGENISDYVSNDTFIFNGSWSIDDNNKELYRSYVQLAKKADSSTTITINSDNAKEIVRFDYMFAVEKGQLLGITVNGVRVTEYDEDSNVWHGFNSEVNTIDGKIVIGISYSQDEEYSVNDYAAIRNLKIGRQWTKISSIYNLADNAIWSENYVHVRGVFKYQGEEILYQVVSKPFKGNNDNEGDLFTITYELNEGVIDGENPTIYTKNSEDITLINPTKIGAEFLGWTGSNGMVPQKEVVIPSGSSGNKNYEANWKENIYTISYELNGGDIVNGENPKTYTKGSKEITLINPVKKYYDFIGWTGTDLTEATLNVIIKTGSMGNRSYIANWTPEVYDLICDLNGGELVYKNPTSYTKESNTLVLNNPSRLGYEFLGWTGSNGTTPQKEIIIPAGSVGNRYYTANWEENIYTISYDLSGGYIENSTNPTTYSVNSSNITLINPVRTGYKFIGWSGTDLAEATTSVTIKNGSVGDRSYVANWSINTYNVSYNGNGATSGSMSSQTFTYGQSAKLSSNSFTKTGYTFTGWNTVANGSGTSYSDGAKFSTTSDITLYAQWKVNTYNVSYNGNGATSGSMSSQTFTYGQSAKLSSNSFTKTGYTFIGWSTVANGSGTSYSDGAEFSATSDITLYAQWEANTYYVSYNGNGASGSMSAQAFTYGQSAKLKSNTFYKSGYTFNGWNTSINGSGTSYSNGAYFTATTNTILYAQWKVRPTCKCYGCDTYVTNSGDWCDDCGSVCSYHRTSGYCYEHCPNHSSSGDTDSSDDCSTCGGTGLIPCSGGTASSDWSHFETVKCTHGNSSAKMYRYRCTRGCDGIAVKCGCGYENISHGSMPCPDCH